MAHYLPRKKYLSKLLGDASEDKYCQTPTAINMDSGTSCDSTLTANRSSDSLLTAIVNSSQLGTSSSFTNVSIFTTNSNGNSFNPSNEMQGQTKCHEVPNNGSVVVGDDGEKISDTATELENSPVYFDEGSMDSDDADNESPSGASVGLMEHSDVTRNVGDSRQTQTSNYSRLDTVPHCSTMTPAASSSSLTIAASASMSNLIDDDVLNTLLPSAESFANLLTSLETRDRTQTSSYNEQLSTSSQPQFVSTQIRQAYQPANPMSVERHVLYVKEEQVDPGYDQQSQLIEPAPTTSSGRNRGRGKTTEPRYHCQICGDVAAGYHCGAYVCEACKVWT